MARRNLDDTTVVDIGRIARRITEATNLEDARLHGEHILEKTRRWSERIDSRQRTQRSRQKKRGGTNR